MRRDGFFNAATGRTTMKWTRRLALGAALRGVSRIRRPGHGRPEDRHRRRALSALRLAGCDRQVGRMGDRRRSKRVCAEMKEKCEIVATAWDGIIPALTSQADRRDHGLHAGHPEAQGGRSTSRSSTMTRRPPSSAPRMATRTSRPTTSRARRWASRSRPAMSAMPRNIWCRRRRAQNLFDAGRGQQRPRRRPPRLCAGQQLCPL